jgi:hypothetical protein
MLTYVQCRLCISFTLLPYFNTCYLFFIHHFRFLNTCYIVSIHNFCIFHTFYVFLIHTICTICTDSIIHIWPVTSEHGGKGDHGPVLESMYTACSTHLTTGLACTLSLTRQYMEQGGRLPADCALTVFYLSVYSPYNDFNYGL